MLTAIGTIGEIYIVEDKDEFYFKDGNILWLKNIKGVTVGYLRYALNFFVKEIQSLAVGSAYKALTIEKLNNHKIPVPKKEIQNDTVKELDELSIKTQELMEVFQNKIINLEELKKSYLEQAFAGKL
jgi:type I restriction enzyme S subunit